MKRSFALLCLAGASLPLSGCLAVAAFPAAGAAVITRVQSKERAARRAQADAVIADTKSPVVLTNMTALPAPDGSMPAPAASATPAGRGKVPPGMQFLYGSGEAAALSYQAYLGVIDTIIAKSSDRAVGQRVFSVVLVRGATLDRPVFENCDGKPLAVVLDIDETALLNLGYEADDSQRDGPYDQKRWERWERTGGNAVVATPGMIELARVAKASNVTLVFNSNRLAVNAPQTEAALNGAGLGPVEYLRNLWLRSDADMDGGKDARRAAIAARYCVIAMAGDQLGDFTDLFNAPGLDPAARRALVQTRTVKTLWGHGWFILPNPVYGSGLKGDLNAVFPLDKRWADPGPPPVVPPTIVPVPSPAPTPVEKNDR